MTQAIIKFQESKPTPSFPDVWRLQIIDYEVELLYVRASYSTLRPLYEKEGGMTYLGFVTSLYMCLEYFFVRYFILESDDTVYASL